jgi:malonate transporter
MTQALTLSIPFFAVIFLGMGSRAIQFFDANAAKILSRFAFFIALPAFMFTSVANSDVSLFFNLGFLWRYEISTIIIFLSSAWLGLLLFRLNTQESGVLGLASAYPNYGYMGVPLAIMAFGHEAALPMALILLADTVVLLALVAIFVAPRQGHFGVVVLNIIRTMISNPLLVSVVVGVIFALFGLKLPEMVNGLVVMLSGAAAPTALFALGMTLYGQPLRNSVGEIGLITIYRLFAHPLLLMVIFFLFPGQDVLWMNVAILSACLPVAANVFMLAQHYQHYVGRAATSCLISTVIATVTVPIVLFLLIEGKLFFHP